MMSSIATIPTELTFHELAALAGIAASTLRWWQKRQALKPVRRLGAGIGKGDRFSYQQALALVTVSNHTGIYGGYASPTFVREQVAQAEKVTDEALLLWAKPADLRDDRDGQAAADQKAGLLPDFDAVMPEGMEGEAAEMIARLNAVVDDLRRRLFAESAIRAVAERQPKGSESQVCGGGPARERKGVFGKR